MKITTGDKELIIGKRVTVGAAINSAAAAFAHFYPEQAPALMSAAVPVTLVIQVLIAKYGGITK